jgi:hypothetical protein
MYEVINGADSNNRLWVNTSYYFTDTSPNINTQDISNELTNYKNLQKIKGDFIVFTTITSFAYILWSIYN